MDILSYNREAWNRQVQSGNPWTIPVGPEEIAEARQGHWQIFLTATKPTPRSWFPENLHGVDVLCLASGGGQQGPILAAAGARVTVLDNSPSQLDRDREVAKREALDLRTIQGAMADLSAFEDQSFDLIFHPVSNCFAPHILPVWREAHRVLRHGGSLLAGVLNPVMYIFDLDKADHGILEVRYSLPYSDVDNLDPDELQKYMDQKLPLEFSHTLEEQIGGQIAAGFMLCGFYEDTQPDELISKFFPRYIATRAIKP
jgi:SAM-dependent methyltransferase